MLVISHIYGKFIKLYYFIAFFDEENIGIDIKKMIIGPFKVKL